MIETIARILMDINLGFALFNGGIIYGYMGYARCDLDINCNVVELCQCMQGYHNEYYYWCHGPYCHTHQLKTECEELKVLRF